MNAKIKKLLLALSLLTMLVSACGAQNATLDGTTWTLVEFDGKTPLVGHQPTISYQDGRVSGNSSCNTYGGEYTLKGDQIEFGMLMSTAMACAETAAMTQEQEYLAFLSSVDHFERRGDTLLLFNAVGDALVFAAEN